MSLENLLYQIFEQHLFSTSPIEDEGLEPFALRIVLKYLTTLEERGYVIPLRVRESIEDELTEEVLEMTRKKTYGFLNLSEFRKVKILKNG